MAPVPGKRNENVRFMPGTEPCFCCLALVAEFIPQQRPVRFHFVVTVFDDRFSGYDSDKGALVIHNRHEVLIDGAIQEIFHIGICMDRFIGGTAWNCHDGNAFCFLDIVNVGPTYAPEQVAF